MSCRNIPKVGLVRGACLLLFMAVLLMLAGCGGGSSSTVSTNSTQTSVSNTVSIQAQLGLSPNYPNALFTSVTVCQPGSTSCQTIPDVLVDTGSFGLRLLSSQVTITPTEITDAAGDPLYACDTFADNSFAWGPVGTFDIKMAGEVASSVPVQTIAANPVFAAPANCNTGGLDDNTVANLGANGILGIGPFLQDCGSGCASLPSPVPSGWPYYFCPVTGCQAAAVPLTAQLENPVAFFQQDNNGVLISLPSVPAAGQTSVSGSMIFGIGTQTDNALGSAQIYTETDNSGDISSSYNGTTYTSNTYFDTGSNGSFILDAATLGIPDCSPNDPNAVDFGYYCPASTTIFNITNIGLNNTQAVVALSIANTDTLFTSNNGALSDLAGDFGGGVEGFDWGLPFFFGRSVFVGIEGQNSPAGVVGPYWAF